MWEGLQLSSSIPGSWAALPNEPFLSSLLCTPAQSPPALFSAPRVSQGGLATQTTGSDTFWQLCTFPSPVFPSVFFPSAGNNATTGPQIFQHVLLGPLSPLLQSLVHTPFSVFKRVERPGWKILQVTMTWIPLGPTSTPTPSKISLCLSGHLPLRPRGSPLPSSLGAASESPEGGGRGGRHHRSTLSSWRRRRSPNYCPRAGWRGNPGPSRAARAPPRGRLAQPGQDSASLGTRGRGQG